MEFEIIKLEKLLKRRYKTRPMNLARKIALEKGWKYYNGNKCRKGHNGKRITKDGQCIECRSLSRKKLYPKSKIREKNWELKKNFGITLNQYNEMVKNSKQFMRNM